tara:strand:- start:10619 stop:11881 length:1263 start_codon:yes stop_codon:yes gene_type:complete
MHHRQVALNNRWVAGLLTVLALLTLQQPARATADSTAHRATIDIGTRPAQLAADIGNTALRETLGACTGPFRRSDFSIAHRGAPLEYPEHTRESYLAAAEQGAGIVECDVTFTRDKALVCRHSQCDLHTTTNILSTPLASRCREPFQPARLDDSGQLTPASARCCTSDLSVAEFKSLRGRHDVVNASAGSVDEFLQDPPDRALSQGTLMTHRESIELFRSLGLKMTPELKAPEVPMPFAGLTQEAYARALIEEYLEAGVPPGRVFAQSFDLQDVLLWVREYPAFADQAIYLDGRYDQREFKPGVAASWQPDMASLHASGVRIIAPPLWVLVALEGDSIQPSAYAIAAKQAGLELITWTLERSGALHAGGGWYYQSIAPIIDRDGDALELLHALASRVGVRGVFSDWPATVSFYANCMGLP